MTKYVTHSVPSTADKIENFLSEMAFTQMHKLKRRPLEHSSAPISNRKALGEVLPDMIRIANREAEHDLSRHAQKLGTLFTNYGNVRDSIPDVSFITRIEQLLQCLDRVAKTKQCSPVDREIITNSNNMFEPLEVFVRAHQHQFIAPHIHHAEQMEVLREGEQYIPDRNEEETIERQFGFGPNYKEISKHGVAADAARLGVEEGEAPLALLESLKIGIAHLGDALEAEIQAAQKHSR